MKFDISKSANPDGITLSNNDATIVTTIAETSIRGDLSFTGKVYFEILVDDAAGLNLAVGVIDDTVDVPTRAGTGGATFPYLNQAIIPFRVCTAWLLTSGDRVYDGNGYSSTSMNAVTGTIMMIAFDPTTGEFWYGIDGAWVTNADPATAAIPTRNTLTTGLSWSIFFNSADVGSGVTLLSTDAELNYTPPTGFDLLPESTPSVNNFAISGTVLSAESTPLISRILVYTQSDGVLFGETTSDEFGDFTITALEGIEYIVVCEDIGTDPANALVFDRVLPVEPVAP